jgi:hypothetical protein
MWGLLELLTIRQLVLLLLLLLLLLSLVPSTSRATEAHMRQGTPRIWCVMDATECRKAPQPHC